MDLEVGDEYTLLPEAKYDLCSLCGTSCVWVHVVVCLKCYPAGVPVAPSGAATSSSFSLHATETFGFI